MLCPVFGTRQSPVWSNLSCECNFLEILASQISKLLIIPYVCGVEAVWLKRKFTVPTIMCILLVIVGVGIV